MALANGQVLWRVSTGGGNTEWDFAMRTVSLRDRHPVTVGQGYVGFADWSEFINPPFAGHGTLLAFYTQKPDSGRGQVMRVVGQQASAFFDFDGANFTGASSMAIDEKRIAVGGYGWVEVRDTTGDLIKRIPLKSHELPLGLGLDGPALTLYVRANGKDFVQVLDIVTGAWGAKTSLLPGRHGAAVAGNWVAWADKTGIAVLNSRTRKLSRIPARPSLLSISDRELAWAERTRRGSRIRVLNLSPKEAAAYSEEAS